MIRQLLTVLFQYFFYSSCLITNAVLSLILFEAFQSSFQTFPSVVLDTIRKGIKQLIILTFLMNRFLPASPIHNALPCRRNCGGDFLILCKKLVSCFFFLTISKVWRFCSNQSHSISSPNFPCTFRLSELRMFQHTELCRHLSLFCCFFL